jgi:hypothetical protein
MVLKTPENQRLLMETIREGMLCQLEHAVKVIKSLDSKTELAVTPILEDLFLIKTDIEARAVELGYSRNCKANITICRGQCCKWHFPENLDAVDFFVALREMESPRRSELFILLQQKEEGSFQCPMLKEDGCFFNFRQRPMVCTAAYPCFLNTSYWTFQNEKAQTIHRLKKDLTERLCL